MPQFHQAHGFRRLHDRLITRPQLPRAADCARSAPAERNRCALRNKVFGECFANPWLYFECLGEKMNK